MARCYNRQSAALAGMHEATAQATGALSAMAAREMCQDQVAACAALWAGPNAEKCIVTPQGQITNIETCGLRALLNFVDATDNVRIAEGCRTALDNFVATTCAPAAAETRRRSPWGCRLRTQTQIRELLNNFVNNFCAPLPGQQHSFIITDMVEMHIENIVGGIGTMLEEECASLDHGRFVFADTNDGVLGCIGTDKGGLSANDSRAVHAFPCPTGERHTQWIHAVFGGGVNTHWGMCFRHAAYDFCMDVERQTGGRDLARWNVRTGECEYQPGIWQALCSLVEGQRSIWVATTNSCHIFPMAME